MKYRKLDDSQDSLLPLGKEPDLRTNINAELSSDGSDEDMESSANVAQDHRLNCYDQYHNAGWVSRIFFFWLSPILTYCKTESLSEEILGEMGPEDSSEAQFKKLKITWSIYKNRKGKILLKALYSAYKRQIMICFFINFVTSIAELATPFFVKEIMLYITDETGEASRSRAVLFVFCILINSIVLRIAREYLVFYQQTLGVNASQAMTGLIYEKVLNVSSATNKDYSTGDIYTFIQVDAPKLNMVFQALPEVSKLPFQIFICIIYLYLFIGFTFLSALCAMVLFAILNYFIAKWIAKTQKAKMKATSIRTNAFAELIDNIKFLKFYSWTERFMKNVNEKRNKELKVLLKRLLLRITNMAYFVLTYPLLALSIFLTASLWFKLTISVPVAIAILQVLNRLQGSIRALPNFIGNLIEFFISLERIEEFLKCDEIQIQTTIKLTNKQTSDYSLIIKEGNFHWGIDDPDKKKKKKSKKKTRKSRGAIQRQDSVNSVRDSIVTTRSLSLAESSESSMDSLLSDSIANGSQIPSNQPKLILKDLNLKILNGEFVAIIGEVGSGKSSILSTLIGDTLREDQHSKIPNILIEGSISLVEQTPWILNQTVRDNILFGEPMIEHRYNETIEICQLGRDLAILDGGDLTQIGEKGINLSGGQKARLSLARAVYADKDIILMDDPLSALDAHVKRQVFDQVFLGKLRNRTRVLVTHALDFLSQVDRIIVMEDGVATHQGTYEEIKNEEYFITILEHLQDNKSGFGEDNEESKEESQLNKDLSPPSSSSIQSRKSYLSKKGSTINVDENKEVANVGWRVYMKYFFFSKLSFLLFAITFLLMVGKRCFQIYFDYALLVWVKDISDNKENDAKLFSLVIASTIGACLLTFLSAVFNISSALSISVNLFRRMLERVCGAPINLYFDITPSGMIINKFSKDILMVDLSIPFTIRAQTQQYILLIGVVIITAFNIIWILIVIPIILVILYFMMKIFTKALKEATRLERVTSSPVLTHLNESLTGYSTIRAYDKSEDFKKTLYKLLDKKNIAIMVKRGTQSWFNTRINLLSVLLMTFSYLYCIFIKTEGNSVIVGLMVVYLLEIQSTLINLMRQMALIDSLMISFERCLNVLQISQEGTQRKPIPQIGYEDEWISHGTVEFVNYSVRYRPETPLVLKNINLKIEPGKIGVVGRTGAGKSTLCMCICRILEAEQGKILIDGIEISTVGLSDLRERITIIPQESTLFENTLRFNLDPYQKCTDQEIMDLINKAALTNIVINGEQGLDLPIKAKGSNLSSGEKQLICICRAILRKNKIVIMDEATASIDVTTEQTVQKLINEEFADSTVITVAHRLNTVINSDKILVLGFGEVIEYDTPENLQNNPDSAFVSILNEFQN